MHNIITRSRFNHLSVSHIANHHKHLSNKSPLHVSLDMPTKLTIYLRQKQHQKKPQYFSRSRLTNHTLVTLLVSIFSDVDRANVLSQTVHTNGLTPV